MGASYRTAARALFSRSVSASSVRLGAMKKKKKPTRKPVAPAETDAVDELAALRAIYGDAFQLAPDGSSFSVLVQALDSGSDASADARSSTPSVRLVRASRATAGLVRAVSAVRLTRRARRARSLAAQVVTPKVGYPRRIPHLRVEAVGHSLPEELLEELTDNLRSQAADLTRAGQVVGFTLAEAAREFVGERLSSLDVAAAPTSLSLSLWEEMRHRESTGAGDASLLERSVSGWAAGGRWGDAVADVLLGDADADALLLTGLPRRAVAPRASKPGAASAVDAPTAALALPLAGAAPTAALSRLLLQDSVTGEATPSSSHASALREAAAYARAGGEGDSSLDSEAAAALLVRAVRADESSGDETDGGSDETDDSESDSGSEASAGPKHEGGRALRQALLTGHLLALLTAPRGPLPNALPSLCASLQAAGLLPRWLRDLLLRRPALFDRAFRGTFDAAARTAATAGSDPAGRWALTRFWSTRAADAATADAGSLGGEAAPSRYRADFEELAPLGRGSFGQVMLAINRLDGRKYALKRIALSADQSLASKTLREVATLSRLEHPHIVRYYQAWTETGDLADAPLDDEDEDDASDWRGSSRAASSSAATSSSGKREQRFLYLQMELCRTTMREVLDSGKPVDVDTVWVWLRQILEGLSHIHGQGITHRDLKPSNIFLDAQGRLRIGDFGLARFDVAEATDSSAVQPPPAEGAGSSALVVDSDLSGAVGTFLYTAPEAARGLPVSSKVDLFSVGIIAFELLRRFGTGMQRVAELSDLRTQQKLPDGFAAAFAKQSGLILALTAPDPAVRPAAAELLQSGALPARVGDEHLAELLRSLGESGATYDAIRSRVFAPDSAGARAAVRSAALDDESVAAAAASFAAAAAANTALPPPGAASAAAVERATSLACNVFRQHGAEPCHGSRAVGFALTVPASAGALNVLDHAGALLCLREELRSRFVSRMAAFAAAGCQPLLPLRRYETATVLRALPGSQLPREVLQAEFDVIGPAEAPPGATSANGGADPGVAASDAETIKVALEVAEAAGLARGATAVLSHRELLSATWRSAGVPVEARAAAAALLRAAPLPTSQGQSAAASPPALARDSAWVTLRRQLCDGLGLSTACADRLEMLHRVGGEPGAAIPRLRGALRAAVGSRAASALDALSSAVSMLAAMGVPENLLLVAPLLAPAEPYYSGLFFELHVRPRTGAAAVLAAGGRYDALVSASWPQGSDSGAPGGVGVSFSLSRLASLAGASAVSALDVLVAARGGGGMLRQRIELVSQLWAAGIRAETLPQAAPSLTEQYAHASARRARFLLIMSADSAAVRLKHLMPGFGRAAGREEDVPRAEVVRILAASVHAGAASLAEEPAVAESDTAAEPADEGARIARGGRHRRYAANADRRTAGD